MSSLLLRTALTPEEHLCAEHLAYFKSILRGGYKLPPFNHIAAVRDFCMAAEQILSLSNKYPSAAVSGLYEQHPLDKYFDRPVPTALRKRPYLHFDEVAVLCFDQIKRVLTDEEYWTILGHIWTANTKDKNHYNRYFTLLYRDLFASTRPGRDNAMTPDEWKLYRSLPPLVTVYRGCGEQNEDGLSWTLAEETARDFARIWNNPPRYILEGQCNPSEMAVFFNKGNEKEFIDLAGKVKRVSKKNY